MSLLVRHFLVSVLALASIALAALLDCPDTSQADFDYVVVGAGAGGGPLAARLAESGFSVLVVDAGHDVNTVNSTIPLYFGRAVEDSQMELNYTLDEYPAGFAFQRNDSWYPRARAIGGSALHNALINIIASTERDFDDIASTFQDDTWSRTNMQSYFKRLEHNLYLPPLLSPDHGFNGWLKTSLNPILDLLNPSLLDVQTVDVFATLTLGGTPILDLNSLGGVDATGANGPSFTIDENHNRSTVRERLLDVQGSSSGRLQFSLDTLATKVLTCKASDGTITAYGVTIAPGAALAVAGNSNGKTNLNTKNITVRHEVIVSAGTFQSPQLLMLSGIGDREQLNEHGIETVVHLPGVGTNLQDHDEVSVIWQMKSNFSLFNGCKFLSDPAEDPCLDFWMKSGHMNLYSFGGTLDVIITKSEPDLPEPDILTYFAPAFFKGFFRGFAQELADHHNSLTATVLKAHPSSRGTVRLTGAHPQDKLKIQKFHFQAEDGPKDVAAIREAIKRARTIVEDSLIGVYVDTEIFPGPQAQSDEDIDAHIFQNVFGHHACCTNPIGPDGDDNAVLDNNFKIRGIENLRVVDASSWPQVPGYFITTLTYMISEKAADVILAAAK